MASLQHVYRRGHIFWWRRIHRLFNGSSLDVRLSLKTSDRLNARNRGAALTAMTDNVVEMLNTRLKAPDARPTEDELQAIAKAAYGELLARICDDQRGSPHEAAMHSLSNRAHADYYARLVENGGHSELLPDEDRMLAMRGWDRERIDRLRVLVQRTLEGWEPVKDRFIDQRLREFGYQPHNGLRRMVRRVVYPAYQAACVDAEAALQGYPPASAFASAAAPPVAPFSVSVSAEPTPKFSRPGRRRARGR